MRTGLFPLVRQGFYKLKAHGTAGILVFSLFFFLMPQSLWAMSDESEINIGRAAAKQVEAQYGVYHNARWEKEIAGIGKILSRLAERKLPYTFKILNKGDVNAFALPGGFIYIDRGMIPLFQNEDEAAAVLAHEMSHVELKHFQHMVHRSMAFNILSIAAMVATHGIAQGVVNTASILNSFVLEPAYSREQEAQADQHGIGFMIEAGYDPTAMSALFDEMEKAEKQGLFSKLPTWLMDHPKLPDRIAAIQKEIAAHEVIPAFAARRQVLQGEVVPGEAAPSP